MHVRRGEAHLCVHAKGAGATHRRFNIEAAQARSLIDSIAPVSSSPQQASKSYLSALLKSNAPTEAASTAKSAAEPVADKADKALKAAA